MAGKPVARRVRKQAYARLGALRRGLAGPPWPLTLGPDAPPEPRPGEVTGPPDFVGIGAPRSGSSWMAGMLHHHPGATMARTARTDRAKELHFFDGYYARAFGDADVERYHRYFPRPAGVLAGEWTPGYLYLPWVPEMLHRAAPRARLLVILRDPVDQLVSSINWSVAHGAPVNATVITRHLGEADYLPSLRRWRALGHDLLVVQLEACLEDPSHIRRVHEFVGLDPDAAVTAPSTHRNRGKGEQLRFTDEVLGSVRERFAASAIELAREFPEIDLRHWPSSLALAGR